MKLSSFRQIFWLLVREYANISAYWFIEIYISYIVFIFSEKYLFFLFYISVGFWQSKTFISVLSYTLK